MPSAWSMLIDPVEMLGTAVTAPCAPRRMIEPLPNCFSIWPTAISMALERSRASRSGFDMDSPILFREGRNGMRRKNLYSKIVPGACQAKVFS